MSNIWTVDAKVRVIEYLLNHAPVTTWQVYCHVKNTRRADGNGTLTEGNVASLLDSLTAKYLVKGSQARKAVWSIKPEARDSLRMHAINLKNPTPIAS